ncbi:hypothetical protein LXM94_23365 [Rhizobium sp. TRM95111]|uniref:hypothetical protein n=1 Tax=Rhizobium alarense TaxID=2846851 RepID=UPI001F253C6B|nr:hypothetical protein [Rhizobium alarense]MCF3642909.1 hypothetical protein [Rhizobium alarense]
MAKDRKFNRWNYRPTGSVQRRRLDVAWPFKQRAETTSGGPLVLDSPRMVIEDTASFDPPSLALPADTMAVAAAQLQSQNGRRSRDRIMKRGNRKGDA